MEFKKYQSIKNSYRQKFMDELLMEGLDGGQWEVTEKIHGANGSFTYDGEELKFAKRSGFISDDENFYNHHIVVEKYTEKIKDIFHAINLYAGISINPVKYITVYGELFGASYPHPEVQKKSIKAIQKGVYYSPDVEFLAFDIYLGYEDHREEVSRKVFRTICKAVGLPYAIPLFEGTLSECLEYPNHYQTTIPGLLGLPEIENNICEGNVIRPLTPKYTSLSERVILKNKNEKFTEKDKSNKPPKVNKTIKMSESASFLLSEMSSLINENRVHSVLSKFGPVKGSDFGKVMKLLTVDVMQEFIGLHKEAYSQLEKDESKYIQKFLGQNAAKVIRPIWIQEVE